MTYIASDGTRVELEGRVGTTVMETAVVNGIEGIVAECGGSMMCATCHVYVDPADLGRLPERSGSEDEMLDSTACPRQPNSRLSCQLVLTEALDGLVVRLPEEQV